MRYHAKSAFTALICIDINMYAVFPYGVRQGRHLVQRSMKENSDAFVFPFPAANAPLTSQTRC